MSKIKNRKWPGRRARGAIEGRKVILGGLQLEQLQGITLESEQEGN